MSDDEGSIHTHASEIEKSRPRPSTGSDRIASSGSRHGSVTSNRPGTGQSAKNIPLASRPPSSRSSKSREDIKGQLPPIDPEDDDKKSVGTAGSRRSSAVSKASLTGSQRSSRIQGTRLPQIMRFSRETDSADPRRPDSQPYKVSFSRQSTKMVSTETQTEWSWLEDMRTLQRGSPSSGRLRKTSSKTKMLDTHTEDQPGEVKEKSTELPPSAVSKQTKSSKRETEQVTQITDPSDVAPLIQQDDTYGIPVLEMDTSSESDFSGTEDSLFSEDLFDPTNLPSIGPPQILQYNRESDMPELDVPIDPDQMISEEDMREVENEFSGGLFQGVCEFCSSPVKAFPSLEDQKSKSVEELYCCEEYKNLLHFMVNHPLHEKFNNNDPLIDISPHKPYGSRKARRDAKERAVMKMKERQMARQQTSQMSGGLQTGGPNFYQFTRQMKTINFSLSSQKCYDEGWTIRPESPEEEKEAKQEVYEPQSAVPAWADHGAKTQREGGLFQRFYDNGSPFIIMFEDGTGNIFYPSGRVAISVMKLNDSSNLLTYAVVEDVEDRPTLLAIFEPDGHAATYYKNGDIRVCMDQYGGIELDAHGSRKRQWSWKEQVTHVHAPPIQPLTFGLNGYAAVRIISQENIILTFVAGSKNCRFMVGSKLKCVAPENVPPIEIDENTTFKEEVAVRIQELLNKVSNLLKFPKSPKLEKLPTPLFISNRAVKVDQMKEGRESVMKSKEKSNLLSVK